MSGIRIDDLSQTVLPSRHHELPAMRDGQTVKLRVAQILALMEKGDLPFDLDDFLSKSGGKMSGPIDMDGNALENVDWEGSALPAGLPVGAVLFDPRGVGWPGFLEANGGSFDTGVYPDLAAIYPSGVLPDFTDRVARGAGPLAGAAGTVQNDAMQRITGQFEARKYSASAQTQVFTDRQGMFSVEVGAGSSITTYFSADGGTHNRDIYKLDSGNSPGARVSDDETRVKAVVGKWYIKAYGAFVNTGDADLVAIEQAQQHMVRSDVQTLSPEQKAQVGQNIGVLGVGQTWQDVTGSRAKDTTYTNTTGRMIVVSIVAQDPSSGNVATAWIKVDNEEVTSGSSTSSGVAQIALTANVPPGSTYLVGLGTADTFKYWWELR